MGLFDAIKFLWSDWPGILLDAGNGIETAGISAINTSYFIKGGGNVQVNACEMVDVTADAIKECYQLLENAATLIDKSGQEIDIIKVPTVSASYINILGHDVVSGLNFGNTSLFGNVATGLKNGAADLNTVGMKLQIAESHLRQLKDALNQAGTDLNTAGTALKDGGQKLKKLAGSP
ncbi:MAG: hypothetical protein WCE94_12070 [Candidatus Methanoperedens sp.]